MATKFGNLAKHLNIALPTMILCNTLGHCATLLQIAQHYIPTSKHGVYMQGAINCQHRRGQENLCLQKFKIASGGVSIFTSITIHIKCYQVAHTLTKTWKDEKNMEKSSRPPSYGFQKTVYTDGKIQRGCVSSRSECEETNTRVTDHTLHCCSTYLCNTSGNVNCSWIIMLLSFVICLTLQGK